MWDVPSEDFVTFLYFRMTIYTFIYNYIYIIHIHMESTISVVLSALHISVLSSPCHSGSFTTARRGTHPPGSLKIPTSNGRVPTVFTACKLYVINIQSQLYNVVYHYLINIQCYNVLYLAGNQYNSGSQMKNLQFLVFQVLNRKSCANFLQRCLFMKSQVSMDSHHHSHHQVSHGSCHGSCHVRLKKITHQ